MLDLALLGLGAAFFGLVEAAVVFYLRAFLDPGGTRFPLVELPPLILSVELWREFATLVLLVCFAALAVRGAVARLAAFLVAFGIWDLAYYAALRLIMHWPASWTDWDILFLLPVLWMGPVYAPVLVSMTMIGTGLAALAHSARYDAFRVQARHLLGAALGALAVVASFVRPGVALQSGALPERYPVELLLLGEAIGLAAFADAWRRNRARTRAHLSATSAPGSARARPSSPAPPGAAPSSSAGAPTSTGSAPRAPQPPEAN